MAEPGKLAKIIERAQHHQRTKASLTRQTLTEPRSTGSRVKRLGYGAGTLIRTAGVAHHRHRIPGCNTHSICSAMPLHLSLLGCSLRRTTSGEAPEWPVAQPVWSRPKDELPDAVH